MRMRITVMFNAMDTAEMTPSTVVNNDLCTSGVEDCSV